jgi:hypothetical protein
VAVTGTGPAALRVAMGTAPTAQVTISAAIKLIKMASGARLWRGGRVGQACGGGIPWGQPGVDTATP